MHKLRVSARAIVFDGDKILLNRFGDGVYYNFPGGGIEERETAPAAVVREVFEETGLTVSAGNLVFTLECEPHTSGYIHGDRHVISLFFRCELLNGNQISTTPTQTDTDPQDPTLAVQPVWVPIAQLSEINLLPHINRNLRQYFETGVFEPLFFNEPYENV